ncbi:hypothetical protein SpCBS45565_g02043 [Spizellomyces sp. 'palustris']|nr:hypothetical protein SpCBS45565_g02043 [Spizellomyces sp. 'palustris']
MQAALLRYRDETLTETLDGTLGDVGDGDVEEFLELLKDRSILQSSITPLKTALTECLFIAKDELATPEKMGVDAVAKKLEQLIADMGLQLYLSAHFEDTSVVTVTICGTIFVVDIVISPPGVVTKIKLSYASDTHPQHQQHELADELLTEVLSKGDFESFKKSIASLAFLDANAGFHQIKCIENDLLSIHQIELANSGNDFESVMFEGHGLPFMHCERIGPSVVYWATPAARLEIDWSGEITPARLRKIFPAMGVCRAFIDMESYPLTRFLPKFKNQYLVPGNRADLQLPPNEQEYYNLIQGASWRNIIPLTFYNPLPTSNETAAITYFLRLSPPIAAATTVARDIGRVVGIVSVEDFSNELNEESVDGGLRYGTMLELLVRDSPITPGNLEHATVFRSTSCKTRDNPHPITQSYTLSGNMSTPAMVLCKIPFSHPSQLLPVLLLLRRQLTFNALVRSCFNVYTHTLGLQAVQEDIVSLQLEDWTPPEQLVFTFTHPRPPHQYRLTLRIEADGGVGVVVEEETEDGLGRTSFGEGRVSRIASRTLDVGLVVSALYGAMRDASV